ncbi:hypothetical protein IE077_000353 [Cardiosporidium cionae]|uniref:DUF3752 domain-containing protein n=1 Tax=Cardiosporidium cionae TaxID=476202 RepID=A0ABQ7JGM1_9APIC|nr:hypothetical protein IE077_000353 [Cardiosporidium cionae]|eukprot:KAF8822820.1 hypothetical protein IE077_000353 [Cardiosporidium cionae]
MESISTSSQEDMNATVRNITDCKSKRRRKQSARSKVKKKSYQEKEFSFDREEAARLIKDLLVRCPTLASELRQLYKRIDSGETVMLDGLPDKSLRKKLRHSFQAFKLEVKEVHGSKGYRKPKHCSKRFTKFYDSIASEIAHEGATKDANLLSGSNQQEPICDSSVSPVEDASFCNRIMETVPKKTIKNIQNATVKYTSKGPTMPTLEDVEELKELYYQQNLEEQNISNKIGTSDRKEGDADLSSKRKRDEWMTEAPEMLRGLFKDSTRKHRTPIDRFEERRKADESRHLKKLMLEYNEAMRPKSLLELHREGNFKNDVEEHKQYIASHQLLRGSKYSKQKESKSEDNTSSPWRTFDRERDLDMKRRVEAEDFHRLLDRSKQLSDRFGESQFQSSFL